MPRKVGQSITDGMSIEEFWDKWVVNSPISKFSKNDQSLLKALFILGVKAARLAKEKGLLEEWNKQIDIYANENFKC